MAKGANKVAAQVADPDVAAMAILTADDVPQLLAASRAELAAILRAHAESGWQAAPEKNIIDMSVRAALLAAAAAFEQGAELGDETQAQLAGAVPGA